MISQSQLHQILDYDPKSGLFRWKKNRGRHLQLKAGMIAGRIDARGYLKILIGGKLYAAHRLAWLYVHGALPSQIDHRNRVRTDNRLANLRQATATQNKINSGPYKNNTSGYRGAIFNSRKQKFQARVGRRSFGYFDTAAEAGAAASAARLRLFGEFAPETLSQARSAMIGL